MGTNDMEGFLRTGFSSKVMFVFEADEHATVDAFLEMYDHVIVMEK